MSILTDQNRSYYNLTELKTDSDKQHRIHCRSNCREWNTINFRQCTFGQYVVIMLKAFYLTINLDHKTLNNYFIFIQFIFSVNLKNYKMIDCDYLLLTIHSFWHHTEDTRQIFTSVNGLCPWHDWLSPFWTLNGLPLGPVRAPLNILFISYKKLQAV